MLPVILIIGMRNPQLIARARRACARDVLDKPFRETDLKASVDRVLAAA